MNHLYNSRFLHRSSFPLPTCHHSFTRWNRSSSPFRTWGHPSIHLHTDFHSHIDTFPNPACHFSQSLRSSPHSWRYKFLQPVHSISSFQSRHLQNYKNICHSLAVLKRLHQFIRNRHYCPSIISFCLKNGSISFRWIFQGGRLLIYWLFFSSLVCEGEGQSLEIIKAW